MLLAKVTNAPVVLSKLHLTKFARSGRSQQQLHNIYFGRHTRLGRMEPAAQLDIFPINSHIQLDRLYLPARRLRLRLRRHHQRHHGGHAHRSRFICHPVQYFHVEPAYCGVGHVSGGMRIIMMLLFLLLLYVGAHDTFEKCTMRTPKSKKENEAPCCR